MRPDLKALLALQAKDTALNEAESRLSALGQETKQLDETLQRARESLETSRRALATAAAGGTSSRPRSRAIERSKTGAGSGWTR